MLLVKIHCLAKIRRNLKFENLTHQNHNVKILDR